MKIFNISFLNKINFIVKKNLNIIFLILLLISIIFSFFTVEVFKLFYRDDVWSASFAYNYVTTGQLFDVLAREPGLALSHGKLYLLLYGHVIFFFDNYLLPHRYLSFFLSIVALFLYYSISIRLSFPRIVAISSTFFLSITEHFLLSAHIARTDMLSFILVLLVIYFMIKEKQTKTLITISGAIAAIGLEVHPNTQIVLFMLLFYEISKFNLVDVIAKYKFFLLGYLITLFFIIINSFQYIEEYKKALNFLNDHAIGVTIFERLTWFIDYAISSKYYRWFFYPLLIFLLIFYFLFDDNDQKNKKIINLFFGGLVGFLLLGRLNFHYLLIFFPFAYTYLLSQVFIKKRILAIFFFIFSVFMFVGVQFYTVIKNNGANFNQYIENIDSEIKIKPSTIIVGPDNLWFLYKNNKFYNYNARVDFIDLFENNTVVFISNKISDSYINEGKLFGKSTGVDKLPLRFLDNFKKIAEIRDEYYGAFGIFGTGKNYVTTFYSNSENY